jgi:hypothetical protein
MFPATPLSLRLSFTSLDARAYQKSFHLWSPKKFPSWPPSVLPYETFSKKCVWVCTLNEFHNSFLFPPFLDAKIAVQVGWARPKVYLTTTTQQNEEKESIIVIYDLVKVTLQSFSIF